jgi:hypothetical protein
MSIFSRIARIIRANLPSGSVDDPSISESFYEEYLRKKQQGAYSGRSHSQESRSNPEESQTRSNSEESQTHSNSEESQTHSNSGESQTRSADPNQDPVLAEHYANLEVPYGSDLETVRRAWKKLLQKYHPDLYPGEPEKQELANKLVQGLNHAYKELEKRLSA